MGGDAGRVGAGIATGGVSELGRAAGNAAGGGGGKSSGAPSAPDFLSAAERQAESGRINQQGPFGSAQWSTGEGGRPTLTTSLSPGLQQGAQGLESAIANQDPNALGHARDQSISASYNQAASRLDPQWQQRESQMRSQLAAQGLDPGSEAYGNEYNSFSRGRNDAYSSAMNNAVQQGNQGVYSELAAQNAPYQQLGALHGLTSGLSGQGQQTQYLPAAMAAYQGGLQQYGIDQAGKNSMLGGAAGLGGSLGSAAILASDERLKADIKRLSLDALPGVPFARWQWRDGSGEGFGVIAQDLERVRPDLVHYDANGYRLVDYSFLR